MYFRQYLNSKHIPNNKENNKNIINENKSKIQLNDKKRIQNPILKIEYIDSNDNIYKYHYNKINWSTLTTSYNCSDYLCECILSINYEY